MTARRPCPPAPGPLEEYAARFDDLFFSLAQRRGFREYLTGLLAPRERNKTITCLAGAEPVAGAGMPGVQRLQFFLSESPWEAEQVNDRRLELLREQQATAPHDGGVIVIDDSGDRKDGTATAHVARQYLGSVGKIDNGIVAATSSVDLLSIAARCRSMANFAGRSSVGPNCESGTFKALACPAYDWASARFPAASATLALPSNCSVWIFASAGVAGGTTASADGAPLPDRRSAIRRSTSCAVRPLPLAVSG